MRELAKDLGAFLIVGFLFLWVLSPGLFLLYLLFWRFAGAPL